MATLVRHPVIVSMSEIGMYKRCRRKWWLSSPNKEWLSAKEPALALSLGKAIHLALAAWRTDPTINPVATYIVAATKLADETEAHYRTLVGTGASEPEREKLYEATHMGKRIIENYMLHWKTPIQDGYQQVAAEQEFLVPIPGTTHHLKGFIDAVLIGPYDQIYALDSKTYSSRPRIEVLQSTEQFIGYIWALSQFPQYAERVAGLAYDGMWKRAEVPKGNTLPDLFCRVLIKPAPQVIAEFEESLILTVNEMASLKDPQKYFYRSWDGSCFWGCAYERICAAMSRDEDTDYMRQQFYTQTEQGTEREW